MSKLTLTRITRSNTQSVLDRSQFEVRFGGQTLWGPHALPPGASYDLLSPPEGVPAGITSGSFNTNTTELRLWVQAMINGTPVTLPIPTQTTPVNPNPVPAIPLAIGQRTLVYTFGNASYVIDYRVDGDFPGTTYAFLLGVGTAIVLFFTTLFQLVIGYVQSLTFLVSRLFRRTDRISRD